MADAALLERLIAEDPSFFAELLTQLANTEATPRNQAETAFNSLKERYPEALVIKLLFFVQTGPTPIVRSFSATLLRRVRHPFTSLCDDLVIEGAHQRTTFTVDKCRAESSGPDQLFERIRNDLIAAVSIESNRDVRLKVADLIADLYSKIIGNECWPELLPFLRQTIEQQQNLENKKNVETSVHILAEIAQVLPDSMDHAVDQFIILMQPCLRNSDGDVRLAAIKAIKSFALIQESAEDVAKLKILMEDVLVAFGAVPVEGASAPEAYATLIEMAEYVPSLFEDLIRPLITEYIGRAKDPQGTIDSYTMTSEFLLTLVDGIPEAKLGSLTDCVAQLLDLVMESLLHIRDEADWNQHCAVYDESPSFGELYDLATASIDRLATNLPANVFLPLVFPYAQQWSRDPDWKKRHAILTVIGQMAEGCATDLSDSVMHFLEICTNGLQDPHVRVRWAACQAIGLVADEVGSSISMSHRNQIIRQLMKASIMDDSTAISVHEHGLSCVVNLLHNTEHPLKGPVLEETIKWVLQSMEFSCEAVNKAALSTLSCIASLFEAPSFAPYYNDCMKAAFRALHRIKDPNNLEEIASILDIMTRIGAGTGKEQFSNEYRIIIEGLKGLITSMSQLSDKDEQLSVAIPVLKAAARISSIMTTSFDALEVFRELIVESLTTQPKLETMPAEEMNESDEDDPYNIVIAGKCIRIERGPLEFCTCGMKAATTIARNIKQGFFPMLIPVLEAFLPAMDYKLVKDIRQSAILAQPVLLECATEQHRVEPTENMRTAVLLMLNQQWDKFMEKLGDMSKEINEISAPAVLEAVLKTIEVMQGKLEQPMMYALFAKLQHVFQHFSKLRSDRAALQEDELGSEEMEAFVEEVVRERSVILGIQKVLAAVMIHTDDQYFDQIRPFVESLHQLLEVLQHDPADHETVEIIFTNMTDVCDYSPRGREIFAGPVCYLFEAHLNHVHEGVRQMSAFGIRIIAQKAPAVFQPMAISVLQKLARIVETVQVPRQKNEMDISALTALDNAISALGIICMIHGNLLSEDDQTKVLQLWLQQLPLRHDTEEAQMAHAQLIRAVLDQDTRVLGKNREHLMRIMDVFMDILASETLLANPEDLKCMLDLLKKMEHENGCRQMAEQKLQKWTDEEKEQFHFRMNGVHP